MFGWAILYDSFALKKIDVKLKLLLSILLLTTTLQYKSLADVVLAHNNKL